MMAMGFGMALASVWEGEDGLWGRQQMIRCKLFSGFCFGWWVCEYYYIIKITQ